MSVYMAITTYKKGAGCLPDGRRIWKGPKNRNKKAKDANCYNWQGNEKV